MKIVHNSAAVLRGFRSQDDFSILGQIDIPAASGGSAVDNSNYDSVLTQTTSTGLDNNFRISVADSLLIPGHSFINQAPTIASVDASGNVSRITNGTAIIDVKTPVGTRRTTRVMANTSVVTYAHKNYKSGSVGLHIVNAINTMIASKAPGRTVQEFTTANNGNWAALSATRNASLFTGAMDFSAISLAREDISLGYFPYLLISPRHIICAAHIFGTVGKGIAWKAPDGSYKTARTLSYATYGDYGAGHDVGVAYLDTAITGINPFKFLPSNWANYLSSMSAGSWPYPAKLPCLAKLYHMVDSDSWVNGIAVNDMCYMPSGITGNWAAVLSGSGVRDATLLPWSNVTDGIRGGDSGSPTMLPINGEAVLIGAQSSASGLNNFVAYETWIEAQMNSQAAAQGDSTVYTLGRADLSGFTQYTTI